MDLSLQLKDLQKLGEISCLADHQTHPMPSPFPDLDRLYCRPSEPSLSRWLSIS